MEFKNGGGGSGRLPCQDSSGHGGVACVIVCVTTTGLEDRSRGLVACRVVLVFRVNRQLITKY